MLGPLQKLLAVLTIVDAAVTFVADVTIVGVAVTVVRASLSTVCSCDCCCSGCDH